MLALRYRPRSMILYIYFLPFFQRHKGIYLQTIIQNPLFQKILIFD